MVINTTPRPSFNPGTKMAPFKQALQELRSRPDDVLFVTGTQRGSLYVAARPTKIRVTDAVVDDEQGFIVEVV